MSKERIFIVEDERIIAIDLQRRLERLGYQVCGVAADGDEALSGIRRTKPDLVLMDILLQGPSDGIEIALLVKEDPGVPVIFLSAYTDARTLERAKTAEPLGFILKPFKERELATLLEMALFKRVADSRIREKEQLFSAILNSTTDAILAIDEAEKIVFLNPEAEQILGIGNAEARGLDASCLFTLSDMDTREPFALPKLNGRVKVFKARNLRLTNRNNGSFVVEMTLTRETSPSGENGNYIVSFKDISSLHEITDTLKYQSSHDTLTGLLNRNELAVRLNTTLRDEGALFDKTYALYVDIDHFKVINDSCGTEAGDFLLCEIATRIRAHTGSGNYAARTGGDDFVLVYREDGTDSSDVAAIARLLLETTQRTPFTWKEKEYPITLSIGIVKLDASYKNEHDVMIAGSQAVSSVHATGGNRFSFYERNDAGRYGSLPISEWINKIHNALQTDGFKLFYQPIEPLGNGGKKRKIEILLRMVDETGAIIPPSDFIPIAERYNLMTQIDRWVVRQTFEAFASLRAEKSPLVDAIFCVNLSGASLGDEGIINYIVETMKELSVPSSSFCIEVTETNAILNLTSASRFIHMLHEQGFTFALDDFGSGFSSFNYLKNLPVDYVKIDGCFIRNMDRDPVDYTMVQAITSMCKVLGLDTIGEFAENSSIIKMLHEIGVDYAQGYGISKPLPL